MSSPRLSIILGQGRAFYGFFSGPCATACDKSDGVSDKFVKLSPFIKMNGSKSLKTPFGVSGTFTGVHF